MTTLKLKPHTAVEKQQLGLAVCTLHDYSTVLFSRLAFAQMLTLEGKALTCCLDLDGLYVDNKEKGGRGADYALVEEMRLSELSR